MSELFSIVTVLVESMPVYDIKESIRHQYNSDKEVCEMTVPDTDKGLFSRLI